MYRFNPGFMRDLLLLGMMFIADKSLRQDIPSLRASTFTHALLGLGLLAGEKERQALLKDGASIQKILDVSYILRLDRQPKKRELERLARTQDEYLILRLPPRENAIDRMRVIGANGYLLRITGAGLEYADSIESAYASTINPVSFSEAWQKARRKMRAIYARQRREERQQPRSSTPFESSGPAGIPPAKIREEDWMWKDE